MLRDLTEPQPVSTGDANGDTGALMARVADGDSASFDQLVLRLHTPMLRLACRICGDRGDAEDALQSALTRLWTHAAIYDAALGSVEGWFRRILVNQCLDRRRRLRAVVPLDEAFDIAAPGPSPFEQADANARARRVDAAMARLNPRQRAAIALFHGEGASMAEIATHLLTSPKAVEGLLARARKELSDMLAAERTDPK
jgi:RNA polymerase sigma-70 factor (ECF subfamily)